MRARINERLGRCNGEADGDDDAFEAPLAQAVVVDKAANDEADSRATLVPLTFMNQFYVWSTLKMMQQQRQQQQQHHAGERHH